MLGVYARSASDAWAVGTIDFDSDPKPLIMHWNGTAWRQVASPVASGTLAAVAGDPAGNLWVSGGNSLSRATLLSYNGQRWRVVYGPKCATPTRT